jgi:hypothetical protein
MIAESRSTLLRCVVASLVAVALLVNAAPARADWMAENMVGPWPTEKKVVCWTLLGGSVLMLGYSVFSFVKKVETSSSLANDFPREKDYPRSADCRTAEECAELRTVIDDNGAWGTRLAVAGFASGGLLLASILTSTWWPNGSTPRVAPAATSTGGGLAVEGRF